ncbi:MAG: hypothetical protein AAFX86_01700 [Pseudomonadota bacterium]
MRLRSAAIALLLSTGAVQAAMAQDVAEIDFGNNSSAWANDGECDDPRFEGQGVADITEDTDKFRDAADCEALFDKGVIQLISGADLTPPPLRIDGIQFGGDTSDWANDGECDDPRFSGEGMAPPPLEIDDAYADRSDCLSLWQKGTLTYDADWRAEVSPPPTAREIDAIDFGADTSNWAFDGECDDPRFEGRGMAAEPVAEDLKADANDCRYMFMTGMVSLRQK